MDYAWRWRNMKAAHGIVERIDLLKAARKLWPESSYLHAVEEGEPGILVFRVQVGDRGVTVSANDRTIEERPEDTMRQLSRMAVNLAATQPDI